MNRLEQLQSLWRAARQHDYYFERSDSHRAYAQGRQSLNSLVRQANASGDEGRELLNAMMDWGFGRGQCPEPPGVDLSALRSQLAELNEPGLMGAEWWWSVHGCLTLEDVEKTRQRLQAR